MTWICTEEVGVEWNIFKGHETNFITLGEKIPGENSHTL